MCSDNIENTLDAVQRIGRGPVLLRQVRVCKDGEHYVDNWSLTHDVKIVAKTFLVVLTRRGAH